ncbi:MAG: hypothetical protein KME31_16425 [Tolypothrix carrinoi HA7290-LM1]|jgi:hypothetical protein|nr:hypothetical protein [Tolypothrix carrinoi HA7290-LM1]
MPRFLLTLKQALLSSILVFGLMIFISLSGLFVVVQPSYATTLEELKLIPPEYKPTPEEKIDRAYERNVAAGFREEQRQEAYEQAIKDGKSLNTMEKAYERNVKAEKAENPPESFGEKAKELIEKVTGK